MKPRINSISSVLFSDRLSIDCCSIKPHNLLKLFVIAEFIDDCTKIVHYLNLSEYDIDQLIYGRHELFDDPLIIEAMGKEEYLYLFEVALTLSDSCSLSAYEEIVSRSFGGRYGENPFQNVSSPAHDNILSESKHFNDHFTFWGGDNVHDRNVTKYFKKYYHGLMLHRTVDKIKLEIFWDEFPT